MDNRRTTRGAVPTKRIVTRSSPARVSPVRTRSPSRRSPARKSPVRTKSPARKSPARKADQKSPVKRKASPSPSPPPKSKSGRTKRKEDEKPVLKVTLSRALSPIKNSALSEPTTRTATVTKTSSSRTSTRIKVANILGEGDDEIAKITAAYSKAARDKLKGLVHALTPTPSEKSRHSASRSMSRSVLDDDLDRRTHSEEYSDSEREPLYESFKSKFSSSAYNSRTENKQVEQLQEYGGRIGAFFLIVILSILGFALQFLCTREDCSGKLFRWEKLRSLDSYLNYQVALLYIGAIWIHCLISTVPLGRIVRLPSDRGVVQYVFNGIGTALLSIGAVALAEYLKYPAVQLIYKNIQQLFVISIIYAVILSGWCFLRSKYISTVSWNPYARSGQFLADYFIGREINPKWFDLIDIKLVHYRFALQTTLLLNLIFIYKNLKFAALPLENGNVTLTVSEVLVFTYQHVRFDPIALLTASLLTVYALDLLVNEHHLISSFELQSEGFGALLMLRYALFPFLNTSISKYALEHPIKGVPIWAVVAITIVFLLGVLLKRLSNKVKYEYRLNPANFKFNHFETVPTFQGRRLLVSGLWGWVRQPNYLGDIISNVALLTPLVWRFAWPPLVAILFTIILLIQRTNRLNNRNLKRYNSAWTRYCQRVKYVLVPRVY